jgi:hypothetical protein
MAAAPTELFDFLFGFTPAFAGAVFLVIVFADVTEGHIWSWIGDC